ncbi:MAG: hypothetical protein ACAI38_25820 [Myxococcota bacterium]|nr:hypothetical protein [Myxococcota bacterium]
MIALALIVVAATDPAFAASDATAKAIDSMEGKLVVYGVSAGQEHSLEGSSGEAFADKDGRVRKIAMTFYGETYRALLAVYVRDGVPFLAERRTGLYRGGLTDPAIGHTDVERVYLDGDKVLGAVDGEGKPLAPAGSETLVKLVQGVAKPIIECIAKAKGAAASCESVAELRDTQPFDSDPRIALIKREFERTQKERPSYKKRDVSNANWEMTGSAYANAAGELRFASIRAGGARVDFYYAGKDLLFSLRKDSAGEVRVYYDADKPIRILDTKNKRVRVNQTSYATHVQPIIEYATLLREPTP